MVLPQWSLPMEPFSAQRSTAMACVQHAMWLLMITTWFLPANPVHYGFLIIISNVKVVSNRVLCSWLICNKEKFLIPSAPKNRLPANNSMAHGTESSCIHLMIYRLQSAPNSRLNRLHCIIVCSDMHTKTFTTYSCQWQRMAKNRLVRWAMTLRLPYSQSDRIRCMSISNNSFHK